MHNSNYRRLICVFFTVFMIFSIITAAFRVKSVFAGTYLTLKWTANVGAQTVIGPLAADLNGDGKLEIVVTGGTNVTALNGTDGSVIWSVSPGGIGLHSPFEIADLNKDGLPEIIVAAGTALALHGNNGSVYWRNTGAPADGHFPTVCDIDGYGYPTVFVNSGNGPHQGYDYITSLTYDGKIINRVWCWHPCYGGLTIGDTNFDGRFELYQGDRSQYYNPADDPYKYGGMGIRCLDAHTLTPLWNDSTVLCSSHCPMLADVDRDGQLDVIVADQGNDGLAVLNSTDGKVLTTGGKYRKGSTGMPAHSQPTIFDLDEDGNLEIMDCTGSNPKIWDLYDWKLDATLPRAASEPPKVGDVTGDGKMDIILSSGSSVYIYSYNNTGGTYDQVDYVTGLSSAIAFTLVQDVDNDGFNELIVASSSASGPVYCFNTPAPSSSPLPRTNYQFYSEYKCGASQYVQPAGPSVPAIMNEQPSDGSVFQPLNPVLSVRATDFQGDLMNLTFKTNATGTWEDITSYFNVGNGFYNATPTSMGSKNTTYWWGVLAADAGSGNSTWKTHKFTTYQPAAWWDERWLYRKPITIDYTKVVGNLTDFPILIKLTDVDLTIKPQNGGGDIAFTDYNGQKLDHELETFNKTSGELVVWVKMPDLSSASNTTLYMYYGSDLSGGENASAVWDSSFLAVHHLSETSGTHYDSTSNHNDGTQFGGVSQGVAGKIDGADYFDGVDDYVNMPQVFSDETQFTLEAWFYSDGTMPNPQYIISQWNETLINATAVDLGAHLNIYQNSTLQMLINENRSGTAVSLGTWYYVAGTFDGMTAKVVLNGLTAATFAANLTWPSENMFIGDRSDHLRHFHGLVDEVRFSNIPRTLEWIQTCYNNQLDPDTFYTILEEEETLPPEAPTIRSPSPADGEVNVSISLSTLSFELIDYQGDTMNYMVTTSPDIGTGSAINVGNGTHAISIAGLHYATNYTWNVNATDGAQLTYKSFRFTTMLPPWPWWNNQWNYRKPITINREQVVADLTDFPVLVSITDADLASKAQDDGDDIAFTDYDGDQLIHEIEYFNGDTGQLMAWVRIPILSSTQDTVIYMYYGNPDASDQQHASAVWDSSFLAAHHLSETSGTHYDSTSNNKDGTPYGSLNQNATGKIDGADYFDGIDDHIRLVQVFTNETEFTMEAWIYAQIGARYFISQWNNNTGAMIQVSADGNSIEWYINDVSAGSTGISLNTWYYIVATYDGTTARLYRNAGTPIANARSPPSWPNENTYLSDRSTGLRQFNGTIDEARFSNTARDLNWIKTCYNNQYDPNNFHDMGGEQIAPQTEIRVNPESLQISVDQNFTVSVDITYVHDLYGWEFQLDYDSSILDIASVSIVPGSLNEPTNIYYSLTDEVTGHLWWAVSTTYPTVTGTSYIQQPIFQINYTAIAAGTSKLDLYGTSLADSQGEPIRHLVVNGSILVLGAYADLTTTSVTILDQECMVYANDTYVNGSAYYYPVEVVVQNIGQGSSGPFYVKLEVFWINGSQLEASKEISVPNLDLGESTTVNFTDVFHPVHTGYYRLTATADSQNQVAEVDEENNSMTGDNVPAAVIGDVNGDHEVNILDGVVLSLAWAATPQDARWNIKADVNHDSVINVLDGARLGLHWSETW